MHDEARAVSERVSTYGARSELFWDPPEMMEEVVRLLLDKRQLIFYGPPGTGKTFVARELAKHLMGGEASRTSPGSCSSTRLIRTRISSKATGPCQARTAACRSSS